MKENGLVEFRWHGRGGQGAKTACLLLADAAFSSGKFVQGFPEYGPERMGLPLPRITASATPGAASTATSTAQTMWWWWTRPCWTRWMSPRPVPDGGGDRQHSQVPRGDSGQAPALDGAGVHHEDARRISEETLGRNFPQHPHAPARRWRVSGVLEEERFKQDMEESSITNLPPSPRWWPETWRP